MSTSVFDNKVILITGAASGFGKRLAERLAEQNARLVIGDRNVDGLKQVADALRTAGAKVVEMACDVTREADVKALVAAAVDTYGRLDIGINNAGTGTPPKALIETEEAELDFNFAVNAKGVFFGMKHQIIQMLKQDGGTILNVASMAGIGGAPKLTAYCAAKHAVVGMTRTAAVEYARKNIRINAACPFFSPTPLVTDGLGIPLDFLAQGSPMRRLGTPDEMVSAMLGIISPDNSYMHGQAIAIDGGVSAY